MSDFAVAFLSAVIICGVFRTTMGQIVLRENGRWTFRFRRFDEYDEMMTARLRLALSTAHAEGMEEAANAVRDFCSAMGRIGEHEDADPSKVKASLDILEIAETIIRAKAKESKT